MSKQDVISVDYHTAYHVMGTKWSNAGDNPTNAALATAGNWSATYDIDLIPSGDDREHPARYVHHPILIRVKSPTMRWGHLFSCYGCHDQRHTEECDGQQLCDFGKPTRILKPFQTAAPGTTRLMTKRIER